MLAAASKLPRDFQGVVHGLFVTRGAKAGNRCRSAASRSLRRAGREEDLERSRMTGGKRPSDSSRASRLRAIWL